MQMPESRTLGDLIDEMAARYPANLALICGEDRLTYTQLRDEASNLARGLLALGVRPGDRVASLISNRPEFLITCLAVAKVGAVFAPLNTWHQPRELGWSIRHLEPVAVIAEASFLKRDYAQDLKGLIPALARSEPGDLRDPAWPWLRSVTFLGPRQPGAFTWSELCDLGRAVSPERLAAAQRAVRPDQILHILYTSGSTAEPKGVMLNHRGTVENCFNIGERRALASGDLVWLGSPLFYALGEANCLPATLTHGATLVTQGQFNPERALDTIEKLGCNVLYATSNIIRSIYESPAYTRRRVSSLEKGSAGISVAERRILIEEMGARLATQSFGLTEAYGHCAVGFPEDPLEVKLSTEGAPLPGNEFKVVDPETGASLPAGQVGVLLVRGYTTREYYRNPEETARAIDGDGFFNTGDMGSLRPDGYFRFHSRLKEIIKTGGINVSPVDLEQLLLTHPAISQACVVGIPEARKGEVIVAFVESSGVLDEDGIKEFVRANAASFKVPAHVLFRRAQDFPRLASGKVPRFRLQQQALAELSHLAASEIAPPPASDPSVTAP